MEEIWKQIETWLIANILEIRNDLQPGATDAEIRKAEDAMGIKFPDDVRASYRIHNGQLGSAAELLGDWQLLPLEYMVLEWQTLDKVLDSGGFGDNTGTPHGPVRPMWWNPKWIPVAHNGAGDYRCLDLDPPAKGKVGQIIAYWHTMDTREKLAPSFRAWLQRFAKDLESGRYTVEDGILVLHKNVQD